MKSLENFGYKNFLLTQNLLSLILKRKVLKYLSNIDISKATGKDGIGLRSLKLAAPHIAEHVTFICNRSITSLFAFCKGGASRMCN